MVFDVHPLYYVLQVIAFVGNASLLGFFVFALHCEILDKGLRMSPRFVWCLVLCVSEIFHVVFLLDPFGFWGISSTTWAIFVQFLAASTVLDACACSLYVYIIILYRQHLSDVPKLMRRVWLAFNGFLTCVLVLLAFTGAMTNNLIWFGCSLWVFIVHLIMQATLCNIGFYRVTKLLSQLNLTNLSAAVRKVRILQLASTILTLVVATNQMVGEKSAIHWSVWKPVETMHEPTALNLESWTVIFLHTTVYCVLLFALRRPRSTNEASRLERITQSQLSATHTPSQLSISQIDSSSLGIVLK